MHRRHTQREMLKFSDLILQIGNPGPERKGGLCKAAVFSACLMLTERLQELISST